MRATDFISATALSKKTSATLDALEKGEAEKLIILKNNAPKAVLLSVERYEAMAEEIEDLRLTALARLETLDGKRFCLTGTFRRSSTSEVVRSLSSCGGRGPGKCRAFRRARHLL